MMKIRDHFMRNSFSVILLVVLTVANVGHAGDWPTWRHDSSRSASTPDGIGHDLQLIWSRQFSPLVPAWKEDPRLHYDAHYEPVVMGKTMYVASSADDSLTAIDVDTGRNRWKFFADGPIRFAPVAWKDRLFFGSDDGNCYCLDAATGSVIWRFNGAPSGRLVIGNERLISVWPARTGPVLANGQLHFTVGVWPFEGTMLYGLDPMTGKQLHVSDLRDQAPQGYLVAANGNLYIPCGRSNAYAIRLDSHKRVSVKYNPRATSDYHITSSGKYLFHGDKIVDVGGSGELPLSAHRPVSSGGKVYFVDKGKIRAYDLDKRIKVEKKDRRGETILVSVPKPLWTLDKISASTVHLRAGNRLYAHHQQSVFAIDLPGETDDQPQVSWRAEIGGQAATMLAADGKLFVVAKEGTIYCFGKRENDETVTALTHKALPGADESNVAIAKALKSTASMKDGYCLVFGIGDGELIDALIQETKYRLIIVDPDESRVASFRQRMDEHGLYGRRVVARAAEPQSLQFPPYLASLVTSGDTSSRDIGDPETFILSVFDVLRPYGGAACFPLSQSQHDRITAAFRVSELPNAKLVRNNGITSMTRPGALPGSGDWTHEFGDPANTLMSADKLVKSPLGLLWFGGPSADGSLYYDRHQWAPSMAVIEGRMLIQGPNKFTAVDVYTGRILWQRELPDGISPGRRSNWGGAGYHYVVAKDAIYLTLPEKCLKLSPESGELLAELRLPEKALRWGRTRLWKDLLIVPAFSKSEEDKESQPRAIFALNRHTGAEVWSKQSELGFPLIAIGNDVMYCYEGKLIGLYEGNSKLRRGGVPVPISDDLMLKACNVLTGKEIWNKSTKEPASWLSFSEDYDVVLMSNRNGMEAVDGTSGQTLWTKKATGQGFKGHPENYWDKLIIWKDQLLDQRGPGLAYGIRTGKNVAQTNPLTGQQVDWQFTKAGHHCNYAIASEFLMTFRADTAGFCDIVTGETSRLNGFRPGCRNSLIPANGVLNAPNYGFGCICSYSVFTSLALVHVPEAEAWTYSAYQFDKGRIKKLGINFGAPGDRRAENGTMWLDYPSVGGPSPKVEVAVVGGPKVFRRHPATISGEGPNWVAASGVEGLESLTISLVAKGDTAAAAEEQTYTIRLYFAEPDEIAIGARVFDIEIQGERVVSRLDVRDEAGGAQRMLLKEVKGVVAKDSLKIRFATHTGSTLLCGVEILAED
jgi:outer membrane protein assembly factor BamB/ubiquinone/menaquinone biosynthesis C-methylase UbiE